MILNSRKPRFSIFSCGCNQIKSFHLSAVKISYFGLISKINAKNRSINFADWLKSLHKTSWLIYCLEPIFDFANKRQSLYMNW
jgi:hypothetical protein